jgi:hypothetical protein
MQTWQHVATGEQFTGTAKRAVRTLELPYAIRTYRDGTEALFTLSRRPLWQRREGGQPTPADPQLQLRTDYSEELLWWVGMADRAANAAARGALIAWGLPVPEAAAVLRRVSN